MTFEMMDLVATVPGASVEVEIQNRPNGQVLYIHFDGTTVLRICRLAKVTVTTEEGKDASDKDV